MHSILAARTDFSLGESILDPQKIVDEAVKMKASAVAITDTMSVTGMIDFTNRAKTAGLKPVIGCRLRLTDNPTWRPAKGEKKKHMPKPYYVTAYALSEEGMKALFRLLSKGNSEEYFYYESKLGLPDLLEELNKLTADDIAITMGSAYGAVTRADAMDIWQKLNDALGEVYAELVPVKTPYFAAVNEKSLLLVEKGAKPLVVRPSFYDKGHADAHEVMGAIMTNTQISSTFHKSTHNRDFYVMGVQELANEVREAAEMIGRRGIYGKKAGGVFREGLMNTKALVDKVTYEWEKAPVSLPKMAEDEFAAVVAECKKGWKERFSGKVFGHCPDKEELQETYKNRLSYELSILKKLEFSGYFLLVQDIVRFAKEEGILVGPGRGSVGGSLVAYLMGITECDPIRFNLLFERFINPERIDLPDADLDFMSERRHEVFEYIVAKYGRDRVAGVSNFGTIAASGTIRDVARMFGLPETVYRCSKFVPKEHGQPVSLEKAHEEVAEIKDFAEKHEELWPLMLRLEGTTRSMSQHAAGIVVAGCPLNERAVVEGRKGALVVNWDKRIVEDQGLVKVDILGLNTLDTIGLTQKYIAERYGKRVNLMKIPLDDPKVLENFANGQTTGVFQFESGGMRKLLKELGKDGTITFEDIVAATALYRPGPMESGMMDSYYRRKQGIESTDYDHPLMEKILDTTYGVIVYQEQVMEVSKVLAGYSGAEADKLRKIMGKKLPEEMAKERDKFVQGCVNTIECEERWAGELFDKIEGFAGYGFNRSHSVEYTLISYQAMWLKTNYPTEFFAAALSTMSAEKLPAVIKDAGKHGIDVNMPDINISTSRFEIATDTRLVIPFSAIKGISERTSSAIVEARADGPFANKADFLARVEKRRCNVKHQAALDDVGAFSRIEPGQKAANDPSRIRDQIELLPGLITANVPVNRDMITDKLAKVHIAKIIDEYRTRHGPDTGDSDGMPVMPAFGRSARFMIISDCPNGPEEEAGKFSYGKASAAVIDALSEHGMSRADVYWTGLIKRPKSGKQVTPDEISTYRGYLEKEIETLQPPVIVMLGSQTVRHFLPDFKGKASDEAGKIIYSKDHDANLVVGFSPGEIYFDPDKQVNMEAVFHSVVDLLD